MRSISRIFSFAALAFAAAYHFAVEKISDFFAPVFDALMPEPPRLAFEGYVDHGTGVPLDASLQHSLRHEAGVSKRAADRHI